ncbi:MAG: aminoacyl-tRNA hydrolase [Verrucomicrobia bacterium]|nr:aminoacyl-tRNA hydrolase [Verrucomicrobiota bacterium]
MEEARHRLIVGLGNPGAAYEKTRHNVGFWVVDALAEKWGFSFRDASHVKGQLAQGGVRDQRVYLLKPGTYMNLSGESVRQCVDYFKVPFDQLIVVCDDVALPLGTMRIRSKGSSGGHNGLKSIEAHLGTEYYARLRMGVGAPEREELADYVLGPFSKAERLIIDEKVREAVEVLDVWLLEGIAPAMQRANAQKKDEKPGE